ncbi:heme-responsive zinc finger transcription factor HAP1 [Striga asiatica]|uniref:Heme-responsive zinc finger transcription factor HAP1 n=1 Tax=Striga asiatica TaxID=4170 RepID=A0A5A7Q7G7_STRAF|nr:heme-responsive zinc finger transcription factor HAP1 [Striga asiatica]
MPFNIVFVASTANLSAAVWQRLACLSERISNQELLDLVLCFPLQQIGRWALSVWTYLCVSPYPYDHRYYDSDHDSDGGDSSSSSGTRRYRYYYYDNFAQSE